MRNGLSIHAEPRSWLPLDDSLRLAHWPTMTTADAADTGDTLVRRRRSLVGRADRLQGLGKCDTLAANKRGIVERDVDPPREVLGPCGSDAHDSDEEHGVGWFLNRRASCKGSLYLYNTCHMPTHIYWSQKCKT